MRGFIAAVVFFNCVHALTTRGVSAAEISDFQVYSYLNAQGTTLLPGRLYVPAGYATNPTMPRPLILFLHGGGEVGTDNVSQVNGNIDQLLANSKVRGAFLYAPQTNIGWSNATLLDQVMSMVDRAVVERSVDPNRIYVTGISLGGGGAWNFLNRFPDRVAATVPISGVNPSPDFMPAKLLNEPIWAFHGRRDTTVPATVTRNIIDSFLTLAGQPLPAYQPLNTFGPNIQFDFPPLDLHYTDHRLTHVIWDSVYATPSLYNWMFAHGAVPEPNTLTLILVSGAAFLTLRRRRMC